MTDWVEPTGVVPATEQEALGLPSFGRAVTILASTIASTPLRAFRDDPSLGVSVRLPVQPTFLTDPDPLTTPWHWKYSTVEDLILYGNSVGLPGDLDSRTGRPGWVAPIHAEDVWLLVDENGLWWFVVGGETFSPQDLWHVSAGNRSGEVLGRGVLTQYAETLGGSVAADRHSGAYFAGGALPPAVLQSPAKLTEGQAGQLKAKWREVASTREPVILPNGYTLTPLVTDAEKSQLVESRKYNAQEVCMMIGAPAWLLGLDGPSMTYQNIETADISVVRDFAARWADPIAACASKWMLPLGTEARWDWASRMRSDLKTTAEVIEILLRCKAISGDEARAMINRAPMQANDEDRTTPAGVPELTPQDAS